MECFEMDDLLSYANRMHELTIVPVVASANLQFVTSTA
jgi:hypothetical protein